MRIFVATIYLCLLHSSTLGQNTKLLVTTGSSPGDAARKTEVIDLADPTNECSLADYPLDVYDCAAGLVSEGPLVCAGNQDTEPQSNCYIAGQSGVAYTLSRPREGAAGIALPELDVIWVTGGYGGNAQWLSSSELIGPGGASEGPELPIELTQHCMVRLDESRVMMIGGFDNTNYETSANTHIYDFDSGTWSNGPALNQARKLLGCGSFSSAAHGGKTMVVVAGGYFLMDSVEFWDPSGEEGWIQGPALPEALFGDVVVTNPKGDGVLVVGGNGSAGPGGHRTNIYELICTSDGQCKWDQLPQKLQVGRSDHVAMLVPDDSVACKK